MSNFVISGLGDYTNQHRDKIVAKMAFGSQVLADPSKYGIFALDGVAYKTSLNNLTTALNVQADSCAPTVGSDTLTLTQRDITAVSHLDYQKLCGKDLKKKWPGLLMPKGTNTELFEQETFVNSIINQIADFNELEFWKGCTVAAHTAGTFTYSATYLADGIGYLLAVASASTVYSSAWDAASAVTAANIVATVDAMVESIPEESLGKKIFVYMSVKNFMVYTRALRTANYPVIAASGWDDTVHESKGLVIMYPGYDNIYIVGTRGLYNTRAIIISEADNLVYGTDLMDEFSTNFKVLWNPYTQQIETWANWKLGAQIRFPELCVVNFQA